MKTSVNRKLRYGGTSLAMTALIIAVVIAINFIFSIVVSRYSLLVDLTPEPHFTLTDEFYELIEGTGEGSSPIEKLDSFRKENKEYNAAHGLSKGMDGYRDENVCINLLFCVEQDILASTEQGNYVYQNAKDLSVKYPDYVTIEYKDIKRNPARFAKYLSSNTETISDESVIIECGSEFRVRSFESFYVFDGDTAHAYNGEKAFASSILAVTRSDAPLACYTINHGESFPTTESSLDASGNPRVPFLEALEAAGYRTMALDLSTEEIPENCRLLIVYDPKQDFLTLDGVSQVDETAKLDAYLSNQKALMVFMNPDSYTGAKGLANLEEFLGDWGLSFRRSGDDPVTVRDSLQSIGSSSSVIAEYAKTEAARGWTENMGTDTSKPKIVFPNAVALSSPESYKRNTVKDEETGENYTVYSNTSAGRGRIVYDLFTSSESARGYAADVNVINATKTEPLRLMSLSVESTLEQEYSNAIKNSSYVLLCGSTDFGSEACLESNAYGNSDFLLSAFQMSGREPVPVGLAYKEFANYTIQTITTAQATTYTVLLTVIPAVVCLFVGVFVIIRRKNR